MELEGDVVMRKKNYLKIKEWIIKGVCFVFLLVLYLFKFYIDGLYDGAKQKEEQRRTLVEAEVIGVVDGDTIKVEVSGEEKKVRLIGIDAPESVHPDETRNSEVGKLASDFTKDILEDYPIVYLQYDEERQDQYGRELCYVWLSDNVDVYDSEDIDTYMLNAIILQEGYAEAISYYPNVFYAEYFEKSLY